jgi:hypothetical protein
MWFEEESLCTTATAGKKNIKKSHRKVFKAENVENSNVSHAALALHRVVVRVPARRQEQVGLPHDPTEKPAVNGLGNGVTVVIPAESKCALRLLALGCQVRLYFGGK